MAGRRNRLLGFTIGALAVALGPIAAQATVIYRAGPNEATSPQEYSLSQDWDTGALRQRLFYSKVDPFGLHSLLGVQGTAVDNFFTSISVDDVIVTSKDPGATREQITFGGDLFGEFRGIGSAMVIVDVFIDVVG